MSRLTLIRKFFLLALVAVFGMSCAGCVSKRGYKYPYFGGGTSSGVPPRDSGVSRGL